jgi:uncharacterized protein YyaL (SSP411 family)
MKQFYLILCCSILFFSCNTSKKDAVDRHQYTNLLAQETSPYLLQHAHNPVDWRAWNDHTLEAAKKDKKLMIVSIGYAACHWCHVMERESFEDSAVAAVMNKNYINVKVDREERPDVDQIYINAVQLLTGSAGWPLNVITLPDGRPVWGGTYFKKEDWVYALAQMQKLYTQNPERLYEVANNLEEGIKSMDLLPLNEENVDLKNYNTAEILSQWQASFDNTFGGPNRAPKFMMPNTISYLLRKAKQSQDTALLEYVTTTLDKMAYGGIYDHIGGGFSRYSVDKKWHVPHFEKMLYDNGQMVSLYSNAYLATNNNLYKEVVTQTLTFIARECTSSEGAFYSSFDADSFTQEGILEEGAYYIFTKEELKEELEEDFELFSTYYNINSFGLWENNHYVLIRSKSDPVVCAEFGITNQELQIKKETWKKALLSYRNKRDKPRLDDKILTSWNGLMLKGYVDAYKAFQEPAYLEAALKNARFIKSKQLQTSGALFHNYKDGKSTINGYLEDYAAVIDAFIGLYEITLDDQWLSIANELTSYTFGHFFDSEKQLFYFTSDQDPSLITRSFEYRDNVIPASNSMMAKNLYVLSHHFDNRTYTTTASQMLKNVLPEIEKYPSGFSNWLDLLANFQNSFYEIVVVGEDAQQKVKEIHQYYIPNKLVAGSTKAGKSPLLERRFIENETFVYVCVDNACKMPETDVTKAIDLIER